ncbi:Methionyl-tRNA formyltransferase [Minicystis rosea]|nr:Methionyl-tRNA formyltransferase [Minicystis rosea]
MRALFFGTPAIAVPSLDALHGLAEIVGVVCQPDRPAGRGLELKPPPVKVRALELGLSVVQPTKIRTPEFAQWVRDANADAALVIAYGRILPPAILEAPRRGCLNLHASILPKYRGAAPITWAVVNGEKETGISLMQMDEGMDTGAVFTIHRIPIGPETTADELGVDLGKLAADVVRADLVRVVEGAVTATPQDHASATMAPILEKDHGRIAWDRPAHAVHDHVRGMTSWPGAFTTAQGKTLKVLESRTGAETGSSAPPGTVVAAGKQGIEVACGAGTLRILKAQAEGRKPLGAAELVGGRTIVAGMVLGG